MVDIDVYRETDNYMKFQNLRPDYTGAIDTSIKEAINYTRLKYKIVVADFCCGTGSNTKKLADSLNGIKKAVLIDINSKFLEIAINSSIKSEKIDTICQDILNVNLNKECDLVFSIFAYHHVSDDKKKKYLEQVRSALNKNGILILTEIFFNNRDECLKYYGDLFISIDKSKIVPGLKKFLKQTAESNDFEFKVSKKFADKQLIEEGFTKIEEERIWPLNNSLSKDQGTFVQVYKLKRN